MSMNRFKLKAFKKEFPFLNEIIGDNIPDVIRIKRADENLLRLTPRYSRHDGSMGRTVLSEKIHFILDDGTIIENAVSQDGWLSSNYGGEEPRSWNGETVLESIDRHGISKSLIFIVAETHYINDWTGDKRTEEYAITIYKAPKGTTFGAEIEKALVRAISEVRVEADF